MERPSTSEKSFHEWKNADVVGKSVLETGLTLTGRLSRLNFHPDWTFILSERSSELDVYPAPCIY
jgi:hypothetical protein